MAIPYCFTVFKDSVENILQPDDAQALLDDVRKRAETRFRKRMKGRAEAYNTSVDELIAERELQQKKSQIRSYKNILRAKKAVDQIVRGKKVIERAAPGFFIGYESNIPGSRDSVSNSIKNMQIDVGSNLVTNLYKNEVKEVFDNRKTSTDLARALYGDTDVKSNILKTARVIKDVQSYLLKLMNNYDIDPFEAKNYIAKLVHNKAKMLSPTGSGIKDSFLRSKLLTKHKGNYDLAKKEFEEIAYQKWRSHIVPLTGERTFGVIKLISSDKINHIQNIEDNPEEIEKFFKGFYRSVTSGIRKFPVSERGHPFITNINSNIAKKLEAERVWFPKDGESWAKYNEKYGWGTTQDAVVAQLNRTAHTLGLIEKLGTSPSVSGERIIRRFASKLRDDDSVTPQRVAKAVKNARKALAGVVGDPYDVVDGFMGKIFNTLNFTAYAKLGSILLSAVPDVNAMASGMRPYGIKYLKVQSDFMKHLITGMSKGEYRELGLELGTYTEGTMGSLYTRFGSIANPGQFSKLLELQDGMSFINYWDNIGKSSLGMTLSNHFSHTLSKDFKNLPLLTQNAYLKYGIDDKFWSLLQGAKKNILVIKGRKFITPSIVNDIEESELVDKWFNGKVGRNRKLKIELARKEIHSRLKNFFIDSVSYGKIFPDVGDRILLKQYTHIGGAFGKFLLTFKTFGFAQTRRTFGRFMFSQGASNLYEAIIGGKADFGGLTSYILGSIPYGYLSMAANYMARGLQPPSLTDKKTWMEALTRGGALFMYGDLLFHTYDKTHRVSSSILGPQINTIKDVLNLLGQIGAGKKKSAENAAINLVRNNVPFINTFYFKKALDKALFDRLHNAVDPTYKMKEEKWQRKNNMTPLF